MSELDLNTLLKGIAERTPPDAVPENLEAPLDAISDELRKMGTLAHADINWETVSDSSIVVLAEVNHFNAFYGLAQSLLNGDDPADIDRAVHLLRAWAALDDQRIAPIAKRYSKLKNTQLQNSIDRFATRLAQSGLTPQMRDEVTLLVNTIQSKALKDSALKELLAVEPSAKSTSTAEETAAPQSAAALDAKGRADLKRNLVALAERVDAHDPENPLGYHIRAHAAWLDFGVMPEINAKGLTDRQAMPPNITQSLQKYVENPSPHGLREIEKRLLLSPDWFEGHYFAYAVAEKLGLKRIASAIVERVGARLDALPDLRTARYANDTPLFPPAFVAIIDGQTKPAETSAHGGSSEEGNDAPIDPVAKLQALDTEMQVSLTPREKTIVNIRRIHVYLELELHQLAGQLREQLLDAFKDENLQRWDKALYDEILAIKIQ